MRRIRLAAIPGFALLLFQIHGQQPGPAENPVFRVSTTLVQVDAVVTDSQGHQVPTLTAADFELYADGKPQAITHFSYVLVSPPGGVLPPAKTIAKDPLLAAPPAATIRREDVKADLSHRNRSMMSAGRRTIISGLSAKLNKICRGPLAYARGSEELDCDTL